MQLKIFLFGQLTDIAGGDTIFINDAPDTDQLRQAVYAQYPAMSGIPYIVAVDQKAIQSNTILNERSSVALLPPFSGG